MITPCLQYRGDVMLRTLRRAALLVAVLTVLSAAALTALLALTTCAASAAPLPARAVGGRLDLSGALLLPVETRLDGEWEFYWNVLLEPADFATGTVGMTRYAALPGAWQGLSTSAGALPGLGFATYRLLVDIPNDLADERLALAIPGAWTAYRLYADGFTIARNGVVSTDLDAVRSQQTPIIAPLLLEAGNVRAPIDGDVITIELILQVTNAHFRSGGLPGSIVMGPEDRLARLRQLGLFAAVFLAAAMIVMAAYHAVFYVWHRNNKTTLHFALFTAVMALRTFVTGELPVMFLFPDLSWEALVRTEYFTSCAGLLLFMTFLQSLFPKDVHRPIVLGAQVVAASGIPLVVALPVVVTSQFIPFYADFVAVMALYSMAVLVRAVKHRRQASKFFLAGGLIFLATVVLTMLYYQQVWLGIDLLPWGMLALLYTQSLTLARRYTLAFKMEAALSRQNLQLLEESRQLLGDRETLYRLLGQQDELTRRSIAEMLHGRTQARLHTAWNKVRQAAELVSAEQQQASHLLNEVQDLIDQVREEDIRQASHLLYPVALHAGLAPALEALARTLEGPLEVSFVVDSNLARQEESGDGRLEDNLQTNLYRIAEEACNNIRRHAAANNVSVEMQLQRGQPDRLELIFTDDGVGFEPDGHSGGLGLRVIEARVAELGGEWEVITPPDGGTRLYISVPLTSCGD